MSQPISTSFNPNTVTTIFLGLKSNSENIEHYFLEIIDKKSPEEALRIVEEARALLETYHRKTSILYDKFYSQHLDKKMQNKTNNASEVVPVSEAGKFITDSNVKARCRKTIINYANRDKNPLVAIRNPILFVDLSNSQLTEP